MTNAKIMHETLTSLGIEVYGGENAPYLWVKTPNKEGSWRFFEQMLYDAQVVCTPGVGFGPSGEGYVRLGLRSTERLRGGNGKDKKMVETITMVEKDR